MAKKQAQNQEEKAAAKPNVFVRFFNYVEASRAELRKITWPTLKDTRKTTLAVLGFVAVMALLLGLIDLGLSNLIKAILS